MVAKCWNDGNNMVAMDDGKALEQWSGDAVYFRPCFRLRVKWALQKPLLTAPTKPCEKKRERLSVG
jgi:hypothetical protein